MADFIASPDMVLTSAVEASIGIAGFTGVIFALLRGRRPEQFEPILSIGLLSALMTLILALLPLVISTIELAEHYLWQICSGLYLIYFVVMLIYRIPIIRKRREMTQQLPRPLIAFTYVVFVVALLQLANVFLFKESWPYLSLVCFYIIWSFSGFISGVWTLWLTPEEPTGDA